MSNDRGNAADRGQFIPVRKSEIQHALAEKYAPEPDGRTEFDQLCRLLAAIFHFEYFDRLERLRDSYFYFNPDHDGHAHYDAAAVERAYRELIGAFDEVLQGANFVAVTHEEVERAHREHGLVRVQTHTPVEDYREVRFYRRGRRQDTVEIDDWYGWRKRSIETEIYDDVVMLITMQHETPLPGEPKRRTRARKRKVRPGAVLIKYFRNIASADLNALYPDVRVVMSLRDKLMLGVPALLGGIPILIKLASTVTVLFLVAGFYLGIKSAVREDEMAAALAAISGLVALGGFIVRQWAKFQRRSLIYQKQIADNVYFRNVNNNAGIFDYVIGAAEEQECKEAILAYHFLNVSGGGCTELELDGAVEDWLQRQFKADVDFECDDALAKLDRLGLLRRNGERLSVLPLREALICLDGRWDDYFQFAEAAR